MKKSGGHKTRASVLLASLSALALAAACSSTTPKSSVINVAPAAAKPEAAGKEYFSEAAYGVKASPRMVNAKRSRMMPRGGGRDLALKAYKVRGKWYYPKEEPGYSRKGQASWYGDAFHGRMTANGEVYDMNHLSAAHPTMPLPSYARVTNLKNGHSVIVRVNDRGPYAHGRIIDMSRRAAQLLDYASSGTAQVKVDYVGRAPLEGRDDEYLMASFQPGNGAPGPDTGLPEGVMVAMNGASPSAASAAAFPGELVTRKKLPEDAVIQPALAAFPAAPPMPDLGPAVPDRPGEGLAPPEPVPGALGYADMRIAQASSAFALMGGGGQALRDLASAHAGSADFILAGSFVLEAEAKALAAKLAKTGAARIERDGTGAEAAYAVILSAKSGGVSDALLKAAWEAGAADAFVVRQ
ncbi:MAG: septal ring lytic transglycosylase RlpA family protein [Rhizobiaceae bacterium]